MRREEEKGKEREMKGRRSKGEDMFLQTEQLQWSTEASLSKTPRL